MRARPALCLAALIFCASLSSGQQAIEKAEELTKSRAAARGKGLAWLTKNLAKDGSWGKTYTVAVTSFACLSYLSAADEPYVGEGGKALVKGLEYLLANQTDGMFKSQGHSWIHGQGFATLALRKPTVDRSSAR